MFVNDKRIYSKLETGAFPDPEDVLQQVSLMAS